MRWTGLPGRITDQSGKNYPKNVKMRILKGKGGTVCANCLRKLCFYFGWVVFFGVGLPFLDIFSDCFFDILSPVCFSGPSDDLSVLQHWQKLKGSFCRGQFSQRGAKEPASQCASCVETVPPQNTFE